MSGGARAASTWAASTWGVTALWAWATFLVGALTWPFWLVLADSSSALALRDMAVLPDHFLTHAALGFGDLPGRNAPQDAFLAVLPFPATWAVLLVVVLAAAGAAWAGFRWAERGSFFGAAAAMTVAVWNPFAVERMLQGQWSLAVAAWLLPLIAITRGPVQWLAIWLASLTPTGALLALATAVATVGPRDQRRWGGPIVAALATLPWVVPSLLAVGDGATTYSTVSGAASSATFAPRAEEYVGTLGALLGLGGVWNAGAVPASRSMGFALFGIALFVLLALAWRRVPRPLLVLAACGFAIPLLGWAGLLAWSVEHIPGGGLLRDSQKFVALALPAFVAAAAKLRPKVAGAALACALLQVPDAPVALADLKPMPAETLNIPEVDHVGRDVFFERRPHLITRADGLPVVDPATKTMNVVESGELTVDGVVVDPPSQRYAEATQNSGNTAALRNLDIGIVVFPEGSAVETGALARKPEPLGVALLVLWMLIPIAAAVAGVFRVRKSAVRT